MSQTLADNFLPSATGYDLGSASQQWDAYIQDLTCSGTAMFNGTLALAALEDIQFADQASGATVTNKIDAALAAATTVVVLVPSSMGAGAPSSISTGKSILDFRTGYPAVFTSYSTSAAAFAVDNNGAIAPAYTTATASPSGTGQFRLANSDAIKVRNSGNTADLNLVSMSGNVLVLGDTAGVSVSGPLVFSGALSGITTISMSGVLTSTLATGTAPFTIASTTVVPNLNVATINGVTVSGAAAANKVLQASSASAASWQTISGTGYTYSASNKRWELFDSTITNWLQDVQPGYVLDANFGTMMSDASSGAQSGNSSFYFVSSGAGLAPNTTAGGFSRIATTNVANNYSYICSGGFAAGAEAAMFPIDAANLQSFWFVVDPVQSDANTTQRVGFWSAVGDPPANGIYLERLGADANWFLVTRAAGVETRNTTGIAHAVGKVGFIVVKNGTTNVKVYQAGSSTALATNSANIVANGTNLGAFVQVKTLGAAVKSMDGYLLRATGYSVTAGY